MINGSSESPVDDFDGDFLPVEQKDLINVVGVAEPDQAAGSSRAR